MLHYSKSFISDILKYPSLATNSISTNSLNVKITKSQKVISSIFRAFQAGNSVRSTSIHLFCDRKEYMLSIFAPFLHQNKLKSQIYQHLTSVE